MTVTLNQVVAAARLREASVAAESGGYLVLAVADQVAVAPRRVALSGVELTGDGRVRLSGGEPCSEAAAERDLRSLLDELLLIASSSTPALVRASRRSAEVGLAGLVREIEAALIPVNRAAAQRALARLARETQRAVERGLAAATESSRLPPAPAASEVVEPAPALAEHTPAKPDAPVEWFAEPAAQDTESPRAPPAQVKLEAEVEVEVEFADEPEPSAQPGEVETRPEPLLRRSVLPPSLPPPPAPAEHPETPRLGTLVAVVAPKIAEADDPAPTLAVPPVEVVEPEITEPMPAVASQTEPWSEEPSNELPIAVAFTEDPSPLQTSLAGEQELEPEFEAHAAIEIEPSADAGSGDFVFSVEPELENSLEPSVMIELKPELDESLEPEPELPLELLVAPEPEPEPDLVLEPTPEPLPAVPRIPFRREPMRSDVQDLLRGFQNEHASSEPEVQRELRRLAGLELTPPAPAAGEG